MVSGEIAASEDFKRLGTEPKLLIHSLVVGAGYKRDTNLKADFFCVDGCIALTKSLAADAVSATGPLF
jgi:hypothetical protein